MNSSMICLRSMNRQTVGTAVMKILYHAKLNYLFYAIYYRRQG